MDHVVIAPFGSRPPRRSGTPGIPGKTGRELGPAIRDRSSDFGPGETAVLIVLVHVAD